MASGPLRHRITVQELLHDQDRFGGVLEEWTTRAQVWASIEPVGGKTFFASRQAQSEVSHRVRIRYSGGVADVAGAKWRLIHDGYVYSVVAAMPDNRRREIVLLCSRSSSRQAVDLQCAACIFLHYPPAFWPDFLDRLRQVLAVLSNVTTNSVDEALASGGETALSNVTVDSVAAALASGEEG